MRIIKIGQWGVMSVYWRAWYEPGMSRYFVMRETDERILEEFRRKVAAIRWAKGNKRG